MSKLTVCLAESAGFCFGVERAVDTVYEVLQEEREKEEKERLPISGKSLFSSYCYILLQVFFTIHSSFFTMH